jgi:hypothetical protein
MLYATPTPPKPVESLTLPGLPTYTSGIASAA